MAVSSPSLPRLCPASVPPCPPHRKPCWERPCHPCRAPCTRQTAQGSRNRGKNAESELFHMGWESAGFPVHLETLRTRLTTGLTGSGQDVTGALGEAPRALAGSTRGWPRLPRPHRDGPGLRGARRLLQSPETPPNPGAGQSAASGVGRRSHPALPRWWAAGAGVPADGDVPPARRWLRSRGRGTGLCCCVRCTEV